MNKKYLSRLFLAVLITLSISDTKSSENTQPNSLGEEPTKGRLAEVPEEDGIIRFPWTPEIMGTVLNLAEDGQLRAEIVSLTDMYGNNIEESFFPVYNPLSSDEFTITPRLILDEPLAHMLNFGLEGRRIMCNAGGKFSVDHLIQINRCLFRTQSSLLEFVGSQLEFRDSFVDGELLNTSFTFSPPQSLNSRIEYIKYIPRKSPAYIAGVIDFNKFTITNFMMTNSDIILKLKN